MCKQNFIQQQCKQSAITNVSLFYHDDEGHLILKCLIAFSDLHCPRQVSISLHFLFRLWRIGNTVLVMKCSRLQYTYGALFYYNIAYIAKHFRNYKEDVLNDKATIFSVLCLMSCQLPIIVKCLSLMRLNARYVLMAQRSVIISCQWCI